MTPDHGVTAWHEPGACQIAGKTGKMEPLLHLVQRGEVNEPRAGFPPPLTLAQVQFSAPDEASAAIRRPAVVNDSSYAAAYLRINTSSRDCRCTQGPGFALPPAQKGS